jgi:hypothetical protein
MHMTAVDIEQVVRDSIGGTWDRTNLHGVDLRKTLVAPRAINLIARTVRGGTVEDEVIDAWLVLVEGPDSGEGYRIVADSTGSKFGLASKGFPEDRHLVLCGWYGDFMSAFEGM